uniref:acetyl-CoA carboxylase beta subunit n=1 Tax=Alpinia nigra TaxID=105678 RepID=UPI001FCCDD63|nr:acetyl-CoA carboxylase beta subunit [Alpinia nigra]UNZ10776.1 acetyl-CoA carboxylase beta subunit [Alpinia nigra]
MFKWRCHFLFSNEKVEHRCGPSKSMDSVDSIGHTDRSEQPILNDMEKKVPSWNHIGNYSFNNVDYLFDIRNIWSLISDDTFFVRDSNGDRYSISFDIENLIFEVDNDSSFRSELEIYVSSYLNRGSKKKNHTCNDTESSWKKNITSSIDSYLRFEVSINSSISSSTNNYNESYIFNFICTENKNSSESYPSSIRTSKNFYDLDIRVESNHNDNPFHKFRHLWVQCENCYESHYKQFFGEKMYICDFCGYHLKMNSSDRIELSIDPGTWDPMDEDMVSVDPIEFELDSDSYMDRIDSYQRKTGLTEAVQTGIGQLNGIQVAIGVMDFQFMGGSMGSVVGEKITRLIEYATNRSLPVVIVCASGGARMQEGSLSLMQMAKISSVLYNYQLDKKLFYVAILTDPTTGGVTASFAMLGDIIIAEPNATIAFAGKRVIEQTLNTTVPEGSQTSEYLFEKGLFDPIVPRNLLKGVLSELFQLHGFFPLNHSSKN